MAPEPLSHLPSSQDAVHHLRSRPADLHSNKRPDTPRSEIQLAPLASFSHTTPAQRAMLLDQAIPAINPHARSPIIRSSSRRRASRNHELLFYSLLTTLELLLLALPVTIVFLAQAFSSNRAFAAPLAAFFVIAFCACLSAAGVGVLFLRRRRSQLKGKRRLEREVQRWRTLARERGREVEVLRAVSERLRSRSRGRRKRDESMSRAGSENVGTGDGREEEGGRSVSRGRTGRGAVMGDSDAEDGIAELDGLEIRMTRGVPETEILKGSVGRAKEAAFARMRGEVPEKPLPPVPHSSPPPPQPPSPRHPPRGASIGWQPRWKAVRASQFGQLSHEPEAVSPPTHWSDSQTLISSPLQTLAGRLQKTVLLPPPELVLDEMDSPGVQTTVLDRYVVPEQYRQALERQQELEKKWTQPRSLDLKRNASGSSPAVGEADTRHESKRERARDLETAFDAHSSDAGDEEDGDVEIGVAKIVRGGNGGRGDAQSDENFKESHALEEDAMSLTESLRQKKRAESLKKVASWEDGTRVAPTEVEEEAIALDPAVEENVRRTARPQGEEPSWREGLGIGRPANSTRGADWEIHERRRNFAMFVETKKLQSKTSSGSARRERAGVGISGKESTV